MKALIRFITKPYRKLFHLNADPEKVARGFALGSFIGMTPFVGMQLILSVSIASLARWNKVAAGLGVFNTNIASGLFIFSFNYYLGSKVLGLSPEFTFPDKLNISFLSKVFEAGTDVFICLLVGGFITGIPLALLIYKLTYFILQKRQIKVT